MCRDHDNAVRIANKYIRENKRFTYDDIVKELQEKAGTTWLSPYYHISDFLENMIYWKVLKREGKYFVRI